MENFEIENRYLKLCYKFRVFIRCMKAAFYRPNYQKFLVCPMIKRLRGAFVSRHVVKNFETLSRDFETLEWAFKTLGQPFESLSKN